MTHIAFLIIGLIIALALLCIAGALFAVFVDFLVRLFGDDYD